MMRAMLFSLCLDHFLERFDGHARLLRADVLHVETEHSRELGEIIDASAGVDHGQHVAVPNGFALLVAEADIVAIGVLVFNSARFSALLNE